VNVCSITEIKMRATHMIASYIVCDYKLTGDIKIKQNLMNECRIKLK